MKTLIITILVCLFSLTAPIQLCLSWTEYTNVRYMDFDGDLVDEVIIECRHGAGTGHYIEDVRIFKDAYPELELIFTIRTLDSTFGFSGEEEKYNCDIVSDVKFTEQTPENKGIRDIIVKIKKDIL